MVDSFEFGGNIVWEPSPEYIERANLTHFMRQHAIKNFDELMRRSTEDIAWFTESVLQFLDIQFYKPYSLGVSAYGLYVPDGKSDKETLLGHYHKLVIIHNLFNGNYISVPLRCPYRYDSFSRAVSDPVITDR